MRKIYVLPHRVKPSSVYLHSCPKWLNFQTLCLVRIAGVCSKINMAQLLERLERHRMLVCQGLKSTYVLYLQYDNQEVPCVCVFACVCVYVFVNVHLMVGF